jgi:hypothetical protein
VSPASESQSLNDLSDIYTRPASLVALVKGFGFDTDIDAVSDPKSYAIKCKENTFIEHQRSPQIGQANKLRFLLCSIALLLIFYLATQWHIGELFGL